MRRTTIDAHKPMLVALMMIGLVGIISGCGEKKVTPPPIGPPQPIAATLTASPTSITAGQSSTLTWTTQNASDVTLEGEKVDPNGSQSVSPAQTTTYYLSAKGAGGTQEATAEVRVAPAPTPMPTPAPTPQSSTEEQLFAQSVVDIFFDNGSSDLRPEAQQTLAHAAEAIKAHPNWSVQIEGYADEPGGIEYNLRLGDKRAIRARNALVASGVRIDQFRVISYGAEKPLCLQNTEDCKQSNRRVHFVLRQDKNVPEPRITSRTLLRSDKWEEDGYGLYSYVLFSKSPTEAQRPIYLKLIHTYLSQFRATEEYGGVPQTPIAGRTAPAPIIPSAKPIPPSRLNVTYLPVIATKIDECLVPDYEKRFGRSPEECVLDAYDYRRAYNLLSRLDSLYPASRRKHSAGPYIISTLEPIDQITKSNLIYLNQDLTRIPLEVIGDHVNVFIQKTAGPIGVTKRTIKTFMLDLRTGIAQLTGTTEDVLATVSLVWPSKSSQ